MATNNYHLYPPVFPDLEQWPIYKLSEDRADFLEEINNFTLEKILKNASNDDVQNKIAAALYTERIRIKEEPWKVDPPDDRAFWKKISSKLFGAPLETPNHAELRNSYTNLTRRIVARYSDEIVGNFRISTFLFARKFLTFFFSRLLNVAASRNWQRLWGKKYHLQDSLKVMGEVEAIRTLSQKGTVVVVPTHFSNLDSILVGYAMDAMVGLPSFSYGAGLNLYNAGIPAYFMNRLGAYRVDRRKKNDIYLETLKAMSNLSIQRGTHSLFFPGGTRSRSGELERKLKLGLLGTAVEAQRANCEKGKSDKIFVVPLVMSYHFVLEAKYLVEQHLKITGKENYVRQKDEFYSLRKIAKFAWQFFSQSSEILLSFGKPMDVMGNFVDTDGNSSDQFGNKLDIADYFRSNTTVKADPQKESEYTIQLAEKIVKRFQVENIVLSSHVVAFAAFRLLLHKYEKLDLYEILRLPADDYYFPPAAFENVIEKMQSILLDMEVKGQLKVAQEIRQTPHELMTHGINHLGLYHPQKPLKFDKKNNIVSEDFRILYYYHNRLNNYNLHSRLRWESFQAIQPVAE